MKRWFAKNSEPDRWRLYLKGSLFLLVLLLLGYAVSDFDFDKYFESLPFSNAVGVPWYYGPIGFTLFGALAISVSCPRQVISFFAAYFFGLWTGIVASVIAASLACVLTFFLARLFQDRVRGLIKGRLSLAVEFWKENTFVATMIWRFMPAGSNLITNLAAGAIGIPAASFILGSAIGYIPQTVIFAFIGSGVKVDSDFQLMVSAILFAISLVMGYFLVSRYRKKLNRA